MPPFVIAIVVLVGGVWLLRQYAKLTPGQSKILTSKLISGAIMAFSALLMLRGQFTLGSGLFVFGLGLYGTAQLPNLKSMWQNKFKRPAGQGTAGQTREQALAVLGLKNGASDDSIRKAHRNLMKDNHPDTGGTAEAAARINAAKDLLLG